MKSRLNSNIVRSINKSRYPHTRMRSRVIVIVVIDIIIMKSRGRGMVEAGMGREDVSLCRSEGGPHEPASCVHGLYNGQTSTAVTTKIQSDEWMMQTPIICLLLALEYIYTAFACLLGHRANTRWRRPGLKGHCIAFIVFDVSSSVFAPRFAHFKRYTR